MAGAGLDEHHVLLHHLPVGALELHGQGGGSVRGAAAAVQAHAAKLWPVGLGGGAAGDLELHGLGDSWGADALFTFLQRDGRMFLSIFHHHVSERKQHSGVGVGGANSPGCFVPAGTRRGAPYTAESVSPGGTRGCRW